jgi:hypothetical protein
MIVTYAQNAKDIFFFHFVNVKIARKPIASTMQSSAVKKLNL